MSDVSAVTQGFASSQVQMMGLLAALGLIPFAVMMLTSFSKMVVVMSLLRSALGTQQAPPTIVLTGIAVVLTFHVMSPTLEALWSRARTALESSSDALELSRQGEEVLEPLKDFLMTHGSPEERARFVDLARELRAPLAAELVRETDLAVVVPAFVITELKEAFIMGFLLFLPFLVLDMVVANVLLALGMQSLSPTQVSLPFKILLFVAVDGWGLLARGLILGYRA